MNRETCFLLEAIFYLCMRSLKGGAQMHGRRREFGAHTNRFAHNEQRNRETSVFLRDEVLKSIETRKHQCSKQGMMAYNNNNMMCNPSINPWRAYQQRV